MFSKQRTIHLLRKHTIISGYEILEQFVSVGLLEKARYGTRDGNLNSMLPAHRAIHCIALCVPPPLLLQGASMTLSRVHSWQIFGSSALDVSGKEQKEGDHFAEWVGCWTNGRSCINSTVLLTPLTPTAPNPSPPGRHLALFHLLHPILKGFMLPNLF